MQVSKKNYIVTVLLCFFLGNFGAHRFYVGKIGTAILMLLTFGGLGIWFIIDFIFIVCGQFKDSHNKFIKPEGLMTEKPVRKKGKTQHKG